MDKLFVVVLYFALWLGGMAISIWAISWLTSIWPLGVTMIP